MYNAESAKGKTGKAKSGKSKSGKAKNGKSKGGKAKSGKAKSGKAKSGKKVHMNILCILIYSFVFICSFWFILNPLFIDQKAN